MDWRHRVTHGVEPPANVLWDDTNGMVTPVCTERKCPQFDGKRCRAFGWAPGRICEPVVGAMTRLLDGNG
jgi:hypothetical protein